MTDIDYADYPAMTADTITNTTALLHHLRNTANDASKTEFVRFNQQGSIHHISGEAI